MAPSRPLVAGHERRRLSQKSRPFLAFIFGILCTVSANYLRGWMMKNSEAEPKISQVDSILKILADQGDRWMTFERHLTLQQIDQTTRFSPLVDAAMQLREFTKRMEGLTHLQVEAMRRLQDLVATSSTEGRIALVHKVAEQTSTILGLQNQLAATEGTTAHLTPGREAADGEALRAYGDPANWVQHTFSRHGGYGFVRYSSYRASGNSFAVLGLGFRELAEARKVGKCWWFPHEGHRMLGKLQVLRPQEHHNLDYEVVILKCTLFKAAPAGGHLVGVVDKEEILMYREDIGELRHLEPTEPFLSNLTMCCSPLHGHSLLLRSFREFVEFHKLRGVDHFVMYDAGAVNDKFLALFEKDIHSGTVDISPFRGVDMYDSWYHGQLLALQDCLYRSRYQSKWIMTADFDEYIWLRQPPPGVTTQLPNFLQLHEGAAAITHGCLWYSVHKCRPAAEMLQELASAAEEAAGDVPGELLSEGDPFLVEKFMFRWPGAVCWNQPTKDKVDENLCPADRGHRKFFANPRKLHYTNIHGPSQEALVDTSDPHQLVTLSAEVLVHAHFPGILQALEVRQMCNETHPMEKPVEWWAVDAHFAASAKAARNGRHCDFAGLGCRLIQKAEPTT